MDKNFYKKLGQSVKAIKSYKNKKSKEFVNVVKKPFRILKDANIKPKEKLELYHMLTIVVSALLGVSVLGFLIGYKTATGDDEIEKFKKNFYEAPNVTGKGREMFEKAFGEPADESIINVKFAPSFGKLASFGVGYDKNYKRQDLKGDYPDDKQTGFLAKLGLSPKWFTKKT